MDDSVIFYNTRTDPGYIRKRAEEAGTADGYPYPYEGYDVYEVAMVFWKLFREDDFKAHPFPGEVKAEIVANRLGI